MPDPGFLGWSEPPEAVDGSTWRERLKALANEPGKWAEYGPYAEKSLANAPGRVKQVARGLDLSIEVQTHETSLFVRVTDNRRRR